LHNKIEKLVTEKFEAEKRIYKLQTQLDSKVNVDREVIEKLQKEINLLSNKIDEKDTHIAGIKKDIDKLVTYQDKDVKGEQYITEPTRGNLEVNNEIYYTADVICKMTYILNDEKQKNTFIDKQIVVM
jgi:predicted RNase H-like nuclease (RuvC/YqgF family)